MGVFADVVDPDREGARMSARRHRLRNHDLASAKEKAPRKLLTLGLDSFTRIIMRAKVERALLRQV